MRKFVLLCACCKLILVNAGSPLRGVKFFDFPVPASLETGLPHFCVFTERSAPYYDGVRSAVQELARREKHRALAFVEIPARFHDTFKFFNFHTDEDGLPFAVVVNWTYGMGKKPYDMYAYADVADVKGIGPNASALQDADGMGRFVGDFFDHRLQPWLRSEPVLENFSDYRHSEGAFQVVQSQWSEVVLQEDVDVLVLFFAPWCGFSKRMQPRIDDLARHLGHVDSLRVVKLDATLNDIKHPVMNRMTGYPFLAMFPAGRKDRAEVIHAKVDNEPAEGWRHHLLELLRPVATHPIPEKPPPALLASDAGPPAEEAPEPAGAFRDLQEI